MFCAQLFVPLQKNTQKMKKTILTMTLLLLVGGAALAQGTVADYKRSAAIRGKYSGKMMFGDVNIHRMRGDGHKFWYSVFNGDSTIYKEVDCDKNTVTLLPGNPEPPRPRRWQGGGGPQRHWMEVPDEKDGMRVSPADSTLVIFHRDNNLWLGHASRPRPFSFGGRRELPDDARQLTTNGDSTYYYSASRPTAATMPPCASSPLRSTMSTMWSLCPGEVNSPCSTSRSMPSPETR